jgi:hypothetical protein
MRIPGDDRPRTDPSITMNQAKEPRDALDPATLEGLQVMDAAQDSLRHQLQTGEMAQDAFEEAWTVLITTVPPAVLKASMQRRHDAVQSAGEKPPGVAEA